VVKSKQIFKSNLSNTSNTWSKTSIFSKVDFRHFFPEPEDDASRVPLHFLALLRSRPDPGADLINRHKKVLSLLQNFEQNFTRKLRE
jgi:hypothetical protein